LVGRKRELGFDRRSKESVTKTPARHAGDHVGAIQQFAGAGRGTNRWGTPYRISPLFIPPTNSELQTGIFVVPARLSLLDQHDQAANPASLSHIVRAVHVRIERKGKNDGIRT
jgi:hypothetical protein